MLIILKQHGASYSTTVAHGIVYGCPKLWWIWLNKRLIDVLGTWQIRFISIGYFNFSYLKFFQKKKINSLCFHWLFMFLFELERRRLRIWSSWLIQKDKHSQDEQLCINSLFNEYMQSSKEKADDNNKTVS